MEQLIVIKMRRRSPRTYAKAATQKGVVLFIALIVLVALALAGISLVRSVDTSNVIAGNLAFKQGTLQAADLGVEAAVTALPTIALDTNSTGATYQYYATRRETDAQGVPTQKEHGAAGVAAVIDWSSVPVAATKAGNSVKVVIERLCTAPVVDLETNCFSEPSTGNNSRTIPGSNFTNAPIVYYRVTAQVSGPRDTLSMVQAILSR